MSTYRELAQRAHERVAANREFAKHHPTQPRLDELYADHQRLADAVDTLISEMHERELHHFETERKLIEMKVQPPAGWYVFGTHVDSPDAPLDFYGEDEDGMPMWERLG